MTTYSTPATTHPHPPVAPPAIPVGLATATQIVAAAWILLAVSRAIVAPVAVSAVVSRCVDPDIAFFFVDALAVLLGLVQLLALVVGGLWLYLFAEAARGLNREAWHERAAYWGFLGWIAPLVNLWFPYQVVRDGAAAVGVRTWMVPGWWTAWIITGLLAGVESLALPTSDYDLTPWIVSLAALAVLTAVTGVLWIRIVRAMTAAARAATTVAS